MISIHDQAALTKLHDTLRLDLHQLRRLRNGFYKKQQSAASALDELPAMRRLDFATNVSFHTLQLHSRHDSRLDGASKLLFRAANGNLVETVILRIASGRTSLCVSSQVGCAARCAFCATGQMGMAVNLTRDEILDQVIQANQHLRPESRSIRNVVFMGMGEPLHNETAVTEALEVLLSPNCFNLAPGRVILSTVGIPEGLVRLAAHFPRLGLALSLHSARQDVRERLIPLARRCTLPMLRSVLEQVTGQARLRVMIEYLLLDGLNDTDDDLQALAEFLEGLPVHINLIPYNPIDAAPGLRGSQPARRRAFAATLRAAGFPVTIRYSLGADIAAACGQLAQREALQLGKE
jgi:23S rRNA (adenine2503-C2)-methyltransferase